jgi:membrane associated rhomboid family serine protease
LWLVLDAARIPARIVRRGDDWSLLVQPQSLEAAQLEIADYRRETESVERLTARSFRPLGGGAAGVSGYAFALLMTAAFARNFTFGANWLIAGRLQAGLTVEGQWWRTVTALTLHVDSAHLVANLAFGAVFGLLLAQALGGGVAWLVILLAGATGNALNAILQPDPHTAIGASTAVFGALGVLVALAFDRRTRPTAGKLRYLSPVIAGFLILVYTGMGGERTDVLAHVTGLVCGLTLGVGVARIPRVWLARARVQIAAAVGAVALWVVAWLLALAAGRAG